MMEDILVGIQEILLYCCLGTVEEVAYVKKQGGLRICYSLHCFPLFLLMVLNSPSGILLNKYVLASATSEDP